MWSNQFDVINIIIFMVWILSFVYGQTAAASALANWSLHLLQVSESVSELGPREDCIREIVKVLNQK